MPITPRPGRLGVAQGVRDEGRDAPHGGFGLGGQSRQGLEDVYLVGPDLQLALAARRANVVREGDRVGDQHLGPACLNERWRQATPRRDVELEPRMVGIDSRAIQLDKANGVARADCRISAQPFAGAGQPERQVDHGGEQHKRGWVDDVGLQEQVDG
jgi:hypothetical protein